MEKDYLNLISKVLEEGETRTDRTGVGTIGLFGNFSLEFDMSAGRVPLLTTKKVLWKKALDEILWMIRGETNVGTLGSAVNIWAPWADADGELGPVYGRQMRAWTPRAGFEGDQLLEVFKVLESSPDTRRALVSLWNYGELSQMALPPCPFAFQFHRRRGNTPGSTDFDTLDIQVFQRSCDLFLGVPFDLFEYGVMLRLMARELGIKPGKLYWTGSDVHIYTNAEVSARVQVSRGEVWGTSDGNEPYMTIDSSAPGMFSGELSVEDFGIVGYKPLGALAVKVAV